MNKIAAMEKTILTADGKQLSVSTSVRIYWRKAFPQQFGKFRNADLNEVIAGDYAKGKVVHKFKLKSGNVGEIRKSSKFYYVGSVDTDGINILVVQSGIKKVPQAIEQERLKPDWKPKV